MAICIKQNSILDLADLIDFTNELVKADSKLVIFQDYTEVDMAALHYESETKTETLNGDLVKKVS